MNKNYPIEVRLFKKRTIFYIILLIILILVFDGCEKEIDIQFMHDESLVLNCIFSPDKEMVAYLSSSASPIECYDPASEENFRIILSDLNDVLYDSIINEDTINFNFFPHKKTYSIQILSDNTTVRATDSIPDLVTIQSAYLRYPAGVDAYGEHLAEASITFRDIENEPNYYELLIYSLQWGTSYWSWDDVEITDPVLINEGDLNYKPTTLFFSDELFDGETYTIKVRHTVGTISGVPISYGAKLRSVSESYYYYRKYYTRHSYNQQFQANSIDIVFRGEPQSMYTNIENGYGIFACYVEDFAQLRYIH